MLCTVILIHDAEVLWIYGDALTWILRLPTKSVGRLRMT